MNLVTPLLAVFFLFFATDDKKVEPRHIVVHEGKMPNIVIGKNNMIHLVYGNGDSIMYCSSKDGTSFTAPALIAVLPGLFASAMRGPQIAASENTVIVTACTKDGNIFSYQKDVQGKWAKPVRINNNAETAKEALMALSADGKNAYAVWLSVKQPKGQNVFATKSTDGGKTWSKNFVVYDSPDGTVCECCKPSVAVKGNNVFVMFRNSINGNRDLYLATSVNAGKDFDNVQKLGVGNWKLKGCPMDGGGLAINKSGIANTVWRREGKIYATTIGGVEKEIGEGRGCTMATIDNKNMYAWSQDGEVVFLRPEGQKTILGKGSQPVLKALDNKQVVCVWENNNQVHASVLDL